MIKRFQLSPTHSLRWLAPGEQDRYRKTPFSFINRSLPLSRISRYRAVQAALLICTSTCSSHTTMRATADFNRLWALSEESQDRCIASNRRCMSLGLAENSLNRSSRRCGDSSNSLSCDRTRVSISSAGNRTPGFPCRDLG
jgi:hypothetical protein